MGWIRVANIIGFILSALLFIYLIYSFVDTLSSDPLQDAFEAAQGGGGMSLTLLIVIGVVLLAAFFFLMFGFIKTGEKTKHKMLRVSSWIVFASAALIFVLYVILALQVDAAVRDIQNQQGLGGQFDFNFDDFNFGDGGGFGGGGFTGNAVGGLTGDFLDTDMKFILILFIIGLVGFIVGIHLFYVAIAEHRTRVRFARPAAIFGFLTFSVSFLVAAMSIFFVVMLLFASGGTKFWITLVTHLPMMLGVVALVYASFFLKDSADRYDR